MSLELYKYRGRPDELSTAGVSYIHFDKVKALEDADFVSESMLIASDYSGNDGGIVRANVEWWQDEFGESEGRLWYRIFGGYGTFGVVVTALAFDDAAIAALDEAEDEDADTLRAMREALGRLDGYPLLDEERHSEIEMEIQNEQRPEVMTELAPRIAKALAFDLGYDEDDDVDFSPEAAEALYLELSDLFGIYPTVEGSGHNLSAVFYTGEFAAAVSTSLEALREASPYAAAKLASYVKEVNEANEDGASYASPYEAAHALFSYQRPGYRLIDMGLKLSRMSPTRRLVLQDFLLEQGDEWVAAQIEAGTLFDSLQQRGFSEFSGEAVP